MRTKEWNWEIADKNIWLAPSAEYYYICTKWSDKDINKVLDLGCGLGRHAVAFALSGYQVSACDLSEYAITQSKQTAMSAGVTNISFVKANMLDLPYKDNQFDGVFSHHVISHTDSQGIVKVISELRRVLRDGGEMFVDFISKASPQYLNATNRIDDNTIIMEEIEQEFGIPHYFVELNDIKELLKEFDIISIYTKADIDIANDRLFCEHYYVYAKK